VRNDNKTISTLSLKVTG